jgi:ArsR family transcriptional regulator, arsenate/arsenite/antimonite-responsive transcriptional repressor
MIEEDAAALFQVFANADRLRVIRHLVQAGPEGLSAGDIAQKVGASPSRASFHLSALAEAGVVQRERQSRTLRYSVDFDRVGELLSFLMDDCCGGSAYLKSCCG